MWEICKWLSEDPENNFAEVRKKRFELPVILGMNNPKKEVTQWKKGDLGWGEWIPFIQQIDSSFEWEPTDAPTTSLKLWQVCTELALNSRQAFIEVTFKEDPGQSLVYCILGPNAEIRTWLPSLQIWRESGSSINAEVINWTWCGNPEKG